MILLAGERGIHLTHNITLSSLFFFRRIIQRHEDVKILLQLMWEMDDNITSVKEEL